MAGLGGSRALAAPLSRCVFVAVSLIALLVSIFGYVTLPRRLDLRQECRMSYMWPSYVDHTDRISSPSRLASKYRLLLYREGFLEPQPEVFPPHGRPALFIPGNAGSYGQVRSVASSSAKQYWAHDYDQAGDRDKVRARPEWAARRGGTDWWTLDFNEDFSAFHPRTLHEQAVFVNEAISFLRETYRMSDAEEIPILAHSMGGIVARLATKLPTSSKGSIRTIVTLSTPHAYPPVSFDGGMEQTYSLINRKPAEQARTGEDVLLVSIAGGNLDTQVAPEASLLARSGIWPQSKQVFTLTTAIPGLWSSVDHLAVMWCDQLRARIARGFLETGLPSYVDADVPQRRAKWQAVLGLTMAGNSEQAPPDARTVAIDVQDSSLGVEILSKEGINCTIRLCKSSRQECQPAPQNVLRLLPPSPARVTGRFPDADQFYEKSGILAASLSPELIRKYDAHVIEVDVPADPAAVLLNGQVQDAGRVMGRPKLGAISFDFANPSTIDNRDTLRVQTVTLPDLSSSIVAYRLAFDPQSCPADSALDAMVRIQSLDSGDEIWAPSLSSRAVDLPINLLGLSPWMPATTGQSKGWQMTSWSSTRCAAPVRRASLRVDWLASAAGLFIRYRTSVLFVPFLNLAFTCTIMETHNPTDSAFDLASRTLMPAATFGWLCLLIVDAARRMWPLSSVALAGASMIGLSPFEVICASAWVVLIGSAFAFLGHWGLFGVYQLVAKCLRRTVHVKRLPPPTRPRLTLLTAMPSIAVALAVATTVPHQVVLLALFIVQFGTCALAQTRIQGYKAADATSVRHWRHSHLLLSVLFWCLPIKAPVLFVWTRNVLHGWIIRQTGMPLTITTSDHNPWQVLPLFWLVQPLASMRPLLPWPTLRLLSRSAQVSLFVAAATAALFAVRKPYILYDETLSLSLGVVVLHAYSRMRQEPQRMHDYDLDPLLASERPDAVDRTVAASAVPQRRAQHEIETSEDRMLFRQLERLDAYMTQRAHAHLLLAQGFLQLGKARASHGSWFASRLGKDGWDGRLKAQIVSHVTADGTIDIRTNRSQERESQECEGDQAKDQGGATAQSAKRLAPDPLFQFGGLPSPALRQAQASFSAALASLIGEGGAHEAAAALEHC